MARPKRTQDPVEEQDTVEENDRGDRPVFEVLWQSAHFVGQIEAILAETGVTRAALARSIGKTPAYVSQVLSTPSNMTLSTMLDFTQALGHRMHIVLYPMNPATIPTPMQMVEDVWDGSFVLNEANAAEYVMLASRRIEGVRTSSRDANSITVVVDEEYSTLNPLVLVQVFSLVSFVRRITGVRLSLVLPLPEPDDE